MYTKWCFTVNNEVEEFYTELETLYNNKKTHIKYICGQKETGEGTEHLHFQGYVQLSRNQRLSWLKNNISETAHFEPQKASRNSDARDYCFKEETSNGEEPLEYGTFIKGKGQRTDLIAYKDAIKSGKTKLEIVDEYTGEFARYTKFYDTVRSLVKPIRDETEEYTVILYYGEPGTGKTRKAWEDYDDLYELPIVGNTIWFDGYDLHKTVLLDDFGGRASKVSLTNTLKILDRYPIQVPIKGGFTWWMPNTVIITTNIHPRNWYEYERREVHWRALKRRIREVKVFTTDGIEEPEVDQFLEDTDLWETQNTEPWQQYNNNNNN